MKQSFHLLSFDLFDFCIVIVIIPNLRLLHCQTNHPRDDQAKCLPSGPDPPTGGINPLRLDRLDRYDRFDRMPTLITHDGVLLSARHDPPRWICLLVNGVVWLKAIPKGDLGHLASFRSGGECRWRCSGHLPSCLPPLWTLTTVECPLSKAMKVINDDRVAAVWRTSRWVLRRWLQWFPRWAISTLSALGSPFRLRRPLRTQGIWSCCKDSDLLESAKDHIALGGFGGKWRE